MEFNWKPNTGATEEEIAVLVAKTQKSLPEDYLNILRKYNGGEGDLALEPMWLQLWCIKDVIENNQVEPFIDYPEYFFFASNGGMESMAFKLNNSANTEIVMFDLVAGIDSCQTIANNFNEFINAIGKEYKG
jgi:hypothetical protein